MGALDLFQKEVQQWFLSQYDAPTDVQVSAWQAISRGENVFVTAPTGSGKTLTAFLWAINQLICGAWPKGKTSVIYISPLKALNNDISANLARPLAAIRSFFPEGDAPDIRVHVRSGDTPQSERRKSITRPPEILITTPESLNILLTASSAQQFFSNIRSVIIDEVHHVAPTKRGAHLMTAVERLTLFAGDFQRIALSATVRPAAVVAAFVGGYELHGESHIPRPVTMVRSSMRKKYDISVDSLPDRGAEGDGTLESIAGHIVETKIAHNRSTLIFANSRRMVEKIARFMNEKAADTVAFSHHGSLSREIRASVEKRLRDGELKALVATNSLELGIDVGAVDEVVLLQTPLALSSAAQRIGRAGHRVGETSRASIFPTHGIDLLLAAVTAECVAEGELERIAIPENPLDVLAQVILSMCMTREWDIDGLYLFLRCCANYHNLTRRVFMLVLDMLAGSYAGARIRELEPKIAIDRVRNRITALVSPWQLYMSGGTIPNRGLYTMRTESGEKIGELDEEFVWERNIGDTFSLGVQTWRITGITSGDVIVSHVDKAPGIVPFWRGEALNRDAFVSGKIREKLALANRLDARQFAEHLRTKCAMSVDAADSLAAYLESQKKAFSCDLPDSSSIVIEHCDGLTPDTREVIMHTFWGGRVNRPLAIAISAMWSEKYGFRLECFADNDAILVHLPHEFSSADIISLLNRERCLDFVRKGLESTGLFGAHFRENAGRALLLPSMGFKTRMPLWMTRLKSKKLFEAVSRFEDFPVTLESWRSCLVDEFDLESLGLLLDDLISGAITIRECHTTVPSPFCEGLVWQQTNKYMYEDDASRGGKNSALSDSLINEIIASDVMRPRLRGEIVIQFARKLASVEEGYAVFDWQDYLKQRIFLSDEEQAEIQNALRRDSGGDTNCDDSFVQRYRGLIIHRETAELLSVFEEGGERSDDVAVPAEHYMRQWLSFYPLVSVDLLRLRWSGLCDVDSILESWVADGSAVVAALLEGEETVCVSLTDNLEALYRFVRRTGRAQIRARDCLLFQNDLARFHHCGQNGRSENLKRLIERIAGYAADAAFFEEYCFPARIKNYDTMWLDSLFQSTSLMLLGAGNDRARFTFWGEQHLYAQDALNMQNAQITQAATDAQDAQNRADIPALFTEEEFVARNGAGSREQLWDLFSQGIIVPDSFAALRYRLVGAYEKTNDKPHRGRSWERYNKQVWRRIEYPVPVSADERFEREKEIVRQLFMRYGIVCAKTIDADSDGISWKKALPVLRVMELSGEILGGHFYEGLGLQFCSHEYFRFLREGGMDICFWLHAKDMISLCGRDIEGLKNMLPARRMSNLFVMRGKQILLKIEQSFKVIQFFIEAQNVDEQVLSVFYDVLNRSYHAPLNVRVKTINGEAAAASAYAAVLCAHGFIRELGDLVLERRF